MKTTYGNLWVTSLNKEQHERTCGYWYTVTTDYATAHTAFETKEHLLSWMADLGLSIKEELPEAGQWSSQRIIGQYSRNMTMDYTEFDNLQPILTRPTMDNGDYTLGKITETNGVRTVHVLNCNRHDRVIYDYRESRELYG